MEIETQWIWFQIDWYKWTQTWSRGGVWKNSWWESLENGILLLWDLVRLKKWGKSMEVKYSLDQDIGFSIRYEIVYDGLKWFII